MKKQFVMAASAATALMLSGASYAQGLDKEEKRFSGVYGGATAGFGDFSAAGDGAVVDFFVGARKQTDTGFVYGIEAVGGVVDSEDREPFLDLFDGYGSIIGKVGYTPNNKVLWYGGVGYTSLDVANELQNNGSSGGAVVEAGVEYMPNSWFGLRLRAQYHAVGDEADISNVGAGIFFSF